MGRNNNNAGMHFVNHSHYGSNDDLSYYDKHSSEYLTNRAYEARAELDAMGEYDFLSYCGIIKIKKEDVDYDDWSIYTLRAFSSEHKKELLRVSTKYILLDNNLQEVVSDEVLVHDSNSLIYIDEQDSEKFDKNKIYRLRKKRKIFNK